MINIFGKATLYISALAGGFAAAKFNGEKGVLSGLSSGALFMLFMVILSLFLRRARSPIGIAVWLIFLSLALVGAVGGYIANPKGRSKRRKRRKNR